MAGNAGTPITETSLSIYFKERLSEHAQRLRTPPHEDTCWYIGNLLERFVSAAHAYCTLGEIAGVLREEFGEYKEPKIL